MDESRACFYCKHWSENRAVGYRPVSGLCVRHAPRPSKEEVPGDLRKTRWPLTLVDDYCSEFERAS